MTVSGYLWLYSDNHGQSALTESGFSLLAALCLPVWALRQHLYGFALVSLLLLTAEDVLLVHSGLNSSRQRLVYVLMRAGGAQPGKLARLAVGNGAGSYELFTRLLEVAAPSISA